MTAQRNLCGILFFNTIMNALWTNYEQEPPGSLLQFQFAIVAQIFLSICSPISLSFSFALSCFPLIRRFVVFLSGLPAKARLCWIMSNSWAVHEQFMNNVGLAFLANTWHESFGKWCLIVCARACLRDWKKHSQRLLKKIHEQVALHSLRRNRLRDCLKTWPA